MLLASWLRSAIRLDLGSSWFGPHMYIRGRSTFDQSLGWLAYFFCLQSHSAFSTLLSTNSYSPISIYLYIHLLYHLIAIMRITLLVAN